MKKNLILTLCLLFVCFVSWAGKFVFIPVTETQNLEILFNNTDVKIHYYCDTYVLATAEAVNLEGAVVLDENAFGDVISYAIVYCLNDFKDEYVRNVAKSAKTLYSGDNCFIMKILTEEFKPAKNDGMVAIMNTEARLPQSTFDFPVITEPDGNVQNFISQVCTESVMGYIQTLENFVTRRYDHANAVLAQNWLKGQYEDLGLNVELQTLPYPSNASKNVIAIQVGTEFPDEYIVLGGHYDSYTYESQNNATGADDDASGSSGVLETARILSQYEFKRSIIYCAFSAEEIGLYGSAAYAQKCVNESMNILGYFNLDMTGYLTPGTPVHFCLIYPNYPALTLADYFVNIADIYFPTIPVTRHDNLPWGDSDHTSFNNKGYKGIWWFEDIDCDSPYIHHTPGGYGCGNGCTGTIPCTGDIIGPSVNSPEQVTIFTQAMVASIATLAEFVGEPPLPFATPTNCVAQASEDMKIEISWNEPTENIPDGYYIYKDNEKITQTTELSYTDIVEDFETHCYTVTAIYITPACEIESEPCNEDCDAVPMLFPPPINCNAQALENMEIAITWEPPTTNTPDEYYVYRNEDKIFETTELSYTDIVEDYAEYCYTVKAVYAQELSIPSNEACASVPSPYKPPTNCAAVWVEEEANINNNIQVTWDAPAEATPDEYYVYRDDEKITQTTDTHFLDALETTGEYCYKIAAIYAENQSDFSNQACATIPIIDAIKEFSSKYLIYPNPTTGELTINNEQLIINNVEIFDIYGRVVSSHQLIASSAHHQINISHLNAGIYFIKINNEIAGKFVKE
jgi:hypothetical protein